MKEIYWIINQLNNTDEVLSAIETANILVQYRSISLIVLGKKEENDINISSKISIIYLDIDIENDELNSFFRANRKGLMTRINELTTKNDLIISTSYISSYIVPKGRRFLYYYLGNKESFLSFKEKMRRRKLRNPDNYIFSSLELKNKLEKSSKYRGSYQIYPTNNYYSVLSLNKKNVISCIINNNKDVNIAIEFLNKLEIKKNKYQCNIYTNLDKSCFNNLDYSNNIKLFKEYDLVEILKASDLLMYFDNYYSHSLLVTKSLSMSVPLICYKNEAVDETYSIIIDKKNVEESVKEANILLNKDKRLEKFKQESFNHFYRFAKNIVTAKWLDILEIEDNLIYKE